MRQPIRLSLVIVLSLFMAERAIVSIGFADENPPVLKVEKTREDKVPELGRTAKLIVEQTNAFRKQQGLQAVTSDKTLTEVAQSFADFMARTDKYGHDADGRTPGDRAKAGGYEFCVILENIAWMSNSSGFETKDLAKRLVTGWKESPGHRKNMVNPQVTETGVALAYSEDSDRYYAVQLFGRPSSEAVRFQVVNPSDYSIQYIVGEEVYTIKPDIIRTHTVCQAGKVTYPKSIDPPKSGQRQPTTGMAVKSGRRYEFAVKKGSISLDEAGELEQPASRK